MVKTLTNQKKHALYFTLDLRNLQAQTALQNIVRRAVTIMNNTKFKM